MDAKSPVSAPVVMLIVAVFVLGGLAGYIGGTQHGAQAAVAKMNSAPPAAAGGCGGGAVSGGCALEGKAGKGGASASLLAADAKSAGPGCPMMAGKDKPAVAKAAACPQGGEQGKCSAHANCPDAGKCPAPSAKAATCPMGGDKPKAKAGVSAACPMGGAKGACADHEKCPDAGKCPVAPAAKAPAKGATAGTAAYGCSMCPTVKSDKPGKCPKCGMALEKK